MPKIEYANQSLRVLLDGDKELSLGSHRMFFGSVLGFRLNEQPLSFNLSNPKNPGKLLRRIISYLSENGFNVQLESGTEELLSQLAASEAALRIARENGQRIHRDDISSVEVPQFVRELMPYQRKSVEHIVEVPFAANFSVPGSGKTTIVYAALSILKQRNEIDRLLVIGPRSSFRPWEEEFEGCFGRAPISVRITGSQEKRRAALRDSEPADIYLLTYQMALNEIQEIERLLRSARFMVVLDESHYIKKFEGGRWAENVIDLAPYARRRVILSGTPAPNGLADLWTQFTFLWVNRDLLGQRDFYKSRLDDPDAVNQIRGELQPFFTRIKKSDLHLPEPDFEIVPVQLKPVQTAIYNALAAKVLASVVPDEQDRREIRELRKAQIIRLLQAISNPTLLALPSDEFRLEPLDSTGLSVMQLIRSYTDYEYPAKLEAAEILARKAVQNGQKVIIWTWFVHNIIMLQNRLADLNPLIIFGEIPKDDEEDELFNRERIIDRFKKDPDSRILIANPSAAAESISLHRVCHHAIYVDRTFNCGQYLQSLDRIHRVGLAPKQRTLYQVIVAQGTIDELVNDKLNEKMDRMSELLNDDLPILDLDQPTYQVTGLESELGQDFEAVLRYLRAHQMNSA